MGSTTIQKTDTTKSPLLRPVIERDYTKGINLNTGPAPNQPTPGPVNENIKPGAATDIPGGQPQQGPGQQQKPNFSPPPGDTTREFSFDEEVEGASDINEGDSPGLTMPAGSAKTFANFVGNAIQMYLPKATYGYVKIDIENVMMNVEKGNLTTNWIEAFTKINESTEKALAISDESIKMWKAAFKDYLEYKNVALANPETAFWAATVLLLADQGVRTYQIKKTNEQYMREAIEASNPGLFASKNQTQPENNKSSKTSENDSKAT